jgi:thiamine biosynthesis protein ThiI
MKKVLLVKYGEIALRGNNRSIFEGNIIKSIKKRIKDLGEYSVIKEQGRLLVEGVEGDVDYETIIPVIIRIFGIVGVCPCIKTNNQEIENLKEVALLHMKQEFLDKPISFKVETKRSDKRYPLESREVSRQVGGYVLHHMDNLVVDVHKPEVTLNVELRNDAYIYSKVIKACGGLPIASTGKAVLLLSGGIDSPVAGWMIAKRGVEVEGVYFHSPPYTSERAKQKVIDLASILSSYTGNFKLHIVPFTDIQLYLCECTPPEKLTLLLKRCMFKISEKIAKNADAQALITGDSIGQVASQTMKAIEAISSATTMPILRPLAGNDKQEIVDLAQKIGSYETSIRPYEDCCTIFVAKHPETKPKKEIIEKIEQSMTELDKMIEEVMGKIEVIEL